VDHVKGLLLRTGIPAFRDDFAHTFFSLARQLGDDLPGELLPDEAQDYLLGDILRLETLPAFEAVRSFPGFRRLLARQIRELKENGIDPDSYDRRILGPLGDSAAPRHRDLGRALAAYERALRDRRRIDSEDLSLRALTRLEAEPSLLAERAVLLVDGFHDFTPVQGRILELLSERIPESIFTLSFDPLHPDHPVFEVSAATRTALLQRGFREERLAGNRRTEDPGLRHLEAEIFSPAPGVREAGDSIRFLAAARWEDEIESIARRIVRLVRERGVPYREIAVLFHDLSEVADRVEHVFGKLGIPVRLYHPLPLSRAPVARFLMDLGAVLASGPSRDALLRLLRSGYVTGLDPAETDRLDAHLREKGAPDSPALWRPLLERLRLPGLGRLLGLLSERSIPLRGEREVPALIAGWFGAFEEIALPIGESGPRGAGECAALEAMRRLAEEAGEHAVKGKGKLPLARLLRNVEEGLAEAVFRVRDRRREVVNVINAFEARQWEVPFLFVAGVLERQFPPAPVEGLFFDDADRKRLTADGLRFPDRVWRLSEERFLFYTAVTRARAELHLSHAVSDRDGNPTLPSFFLREVQRVFTPESCAAATRVRGASAVLPTEEELVHFDDVDRTILLGLEERHPKDAIPPAVALAAALYERRRTEPRFRDRLRAALDAPVPSLSAAVRAEIAVRPAVFSNSALTSFQQCPYLHFAEKWLRLEGLAEEEADPLDLGDVVHETLREYFQEGAKGDLLSILERRFGGMASARRRGFLLRARFWRIREDLERFLAAEAGSGGPLAPELFEVSFGIEAEGAAGPVRMRIEGREERLGGRIDRIDRCGTGSAAVVVDYKYSAARTVREQQKASLAEEILHFQLPLYLIALEEALGREAAGAELVALRGSVKRYGVGRRRHLEEGLLPARVAEDWELLDEEEFAAFLGRARAQAAEWIRRIRGGEVTTEPRDPGRCGPGNCPAADVCRFDRWVGGGIREE
jgi:ATP-dependent helicase/nuclease subunit B